MATRSVQPVTAADYRKLAERRLPRFLFDYVDGGANDELTMGLNSSDFGRYRLRQTVMRDVSAIETETQIAGRSSRMPLILAPIGLAGMMAQRGEVQAARAAEAAGIPFTTSTVGICSVEEVRAAAAQPFWFQLYMLRDRDIVLRLLERAKDAGCPTLVFTVDLAVTGMRHRDVRNGMMRGDFTGRMAKARQVLARPGWLLDVALKGKPHTFGNLSEAVRDANDLDGFKAFIDSQFDPGVTWKDIEWLRGQWDGKLIIKGVMTPDDARAAADCGADGVIVSNHGGRQLDGVASTISQLGGVVAAVGERLEVLMDGGVRSGVDVVRAVSLGARAVLIGRPWVWALAARGEQGLIDLLNVYQQEIRTAMALMGVCRIADLGPELVEY